MVLNNNDSMRSNFLESIDHLKNKFSLRLKTFAVTRSYAHDFKKIPLKYSGVLAGRAGGP